MFKLMVVFTVVSIALSGFAFADTATLSPTDDARVWQLFGSTNYGSTDNFTVGHMSGWFNTLIKFDLSPYAGATVISAKIAIWVYDEYGDFPTNDVHVTMNSADWDEGTVTWNNKPGFNGDIALTAPGSYGWWNVYVTSFVQVIVDGTEPDYGFQIYQGDTDEAAFYMHSKENTINQPHMILTYTPSAIESASLGEIKAAFK